MTSLMSYNDSLAHLKSFVANLKSTAIKFMYYEKDHLDKPKVKISFKQVITSSRNTYYVIHGKDTNYVYAYPKNNLKLLVELAPGVPPAQHAAPFTNVSIAYNVKIINSTVPSLTKTDAYLGDHIDFSIHRQRNQDTLILVHTTSYLNLDYPQATRIEDTCNFRISHTKDKMDSLNKFQTINCIDRHGVPLSTTCHSIFKGQSDIVHSLTSIVLGENPSTHIIYAGKYHGKRGGCYIQHNNRNIYLKKGGSSPSHLDNDIVLKIISDYFIQPVDSILSLDKVTIIYDEENELCQTGNENLVFIYDYNDGHACNVFYVDMKTILEGSVAMSKVNPTIEEKQVINNLDQIKDNLTATFRTIQVAA